MKRHCVILLAGLVGGLVSDGLIAQNNPLPPPVFPAPVMRGPPRIEAGHREKPELTRFDLEFPGGTPGELVKAIEHAQGRPLNAIIPADCAEVRIPALEMKGVTVPQLFDALTPASQRFVSYETGYNNPVFGLSPQYSSMTTRYGFHTTDTAVTDNSVWFFFQDAPPVRPEGKSEAHRVCRFFQMAPYLETYTIDDITTAIQTGWKLLAGEKAPNSDNIPELTFHKDTKLLIAVGEPEKLKLIDSVLEQLNLGLRKKPAEAPAAKPKSDQTSKP